MIWARLISNTAWPISFICMRIRPLVEMAGLLKKHILKLVSGRVIVYDSNSGGSVPMVLFIEDFPARIYVSQKFLLHHTLIFSGAWVEKYFL